MLIKTGYLILLAYYSLYRAINFRYINATFLGSGIRLESRAIEMKKVYATLRVLIDILEVLVRDSSSDGMGKLIMEEVNFLYTFVILLS